MKNIDYWLDEEVYEEYRSADEALAALHLLARHDGFPKHALQKIRAARQLLQEAAYHEDYKGSPANPVVRFLERYIIRSLA